MARIEVRITDTRLGDMTFEREYAETLTRNSYPLWPTTEAFESLIADVENAEAKWFRQTKEDDDD